MAEEIAEMKWDEELEDIIYTSVSGCTRPCHVPKNKEEKKINQMSLANCDLDEVEIVLGDKFELKIEDGKYYAVRKKPTYLTTYDDCCDMLNADEFIEYELMVNFPKLINARNAYWKIAGEELGLDKPWNSKYGCGKWGYWIGYDINTNKTYCQDSRLLLNRLLVFPTKEMRDAFYDNFKDLIEQCKELL